MVNVSSVHEYPEGPNHCLIFYKNNCDLYKSCLKCISFTSNITGCQNQNLDLPTIHATNIIYNAVCIAKEKSKYCSCWVKVYR